jgi:hypothetical protein
MSVYVGLFEATGIMARPWADAGHRCIALDIGNANEWRGGLFFARCDLAAAEPALALIRGFCVGEPVAFCAAFPPCDHLAVSGARWFAGKGLRALQEAVGYFATAQEIATALGAPYLIENPVSTMGTYWRPADHVFSPHDFAGWCADDAYTKRTCLWVGNGFVMPAPLPLEGVEPDDRIHRAAPSPGRKAFRSATPLGFARAVFKANAPRAEAA